MTQVALAVLMAATFGREGDQAGAWVRADFAAIRSLRWR